MVAQRLTFIMSTVLIRLRQCGCAYLNVNSEATQTVIGLTDEVLMTAAW
jgi:hypothetical protein